MIPRQIAAAFPSAVRARGDDYATSDRVHIVAADPFSISATVSGTDDYDVDLTAVRGLVTAMCNCRFSKDNGICKHIWATLRVAEQGRQLDAVNKTAGKDPHFVALGAPDPLRADEVDLLAETAGRPTQGWAPPRQPAPAPPRQNPAPAQRPSSPHRQPEWKARLETARRQMSAPPSPPAPRTRPREATTGDDSRVVYIGDLAASRGAAGLVVELGTERSKPDGSWDPPVPFRLPAAAWQSSTDERDRRIAQMLIGAAPTYPYDYGARRLGPFVLDANGIATALPLICETGRCRIRREPGERSTTPITFDPGAAWTLRVRVMPQSTGGFLVDGVLQRNGQELPLSAPVMLHSAGALITGTTFAHFEHNEAFPLVSVFRERPLLVRDDELPALLESLYALPHRPEIELPAGTEVRESHDAPRPGITVHPDPSAWRRTHHQLEPFFEYGGLRLSGEEVEASVFDRRTLTVHHRDLARERDARDRLATLGAKEEWHYAGNGKCLALHGNKLARMIADLVMSGWRVEAHGMSYHAPGDMRASVRSGIDWFELSASVRFGDVEVALPDLLAARRRGDTAIALPDGNLGLIPGEWLSKLAPLASGGSVANDTLRFAHSQTALLDALLATVPEPDFDATFARARDELRTFDRVAPADAPPTFQGTLRDYQREGLGWFGFLRAFGLGGCLADDMGLGKTVQVLALLEERRTTQPQQDRRPSLVVVPRSLVFNWLREAERFAPRLRLLDYTGTSRQFEDVGGADVVLTTYGTMRRDAAQLAATDFDYVILDEAQAIKTATSASAKAARLLRARHRLAMTGTPIENRLEELWSLFEFLNPGMLGASTTFGALVRLSRAEATPDATDRGVLARALRPVILRRTKAQVASELPARIEQTLHVELEGPQRKFYDTLLESYRRSVLERVERVGLGKARMHILEALLRLRQAACHPVLADARKTSAPSAKLDALVPALEEIVAEGHKALVFSQFTSFLDLARERLDAAGMTYEYLDGKTRDRQARVDRFQGDPACPLFLISLKAGGHGLNLVAADYVFILDPWWNPAVEAQAVDRAHRIGQTRQVIATRIVARDTIEEKLLELQASKRALADAIIGQDQGALSQIGRAELEMLLG